MMHACMQCYKKMLQCYEPLPYQTLTGVTIHVLHYVLCWGCSCPSCRTVCTNACSTFAVLDMGYVFTNTSGTRCRAAHQCSVLMLGWTDAERSPAVQLKLRDGQHGATLGFNGNRPDSLLSLLTAPILRYSLPFHSKMNCVI